MNKNLRKLLRHIEYVQKAGLYMADKLIENEKEELARDIIALCMRHDNDKFTSYMWKELINGDKKSENFKSAIKVHRLRSTHHPEYWGGINNMNDIHLAEMVCDWYARGCEKGSGFDDWMNKVTVIFNPDSKTLEKIKYFRDLLLEDYSWVKF